MSEDYLAKTKQTRISKKGLMLLRVFAGELQAKTAKDFTDDMALIEIFKEFRPDLVERVEHLSQHQTETD